MGGGGTQVQGKVRESLRLYHRAARDSLAIGGYLCWGQGIDKLQKAIGLRLKRLRADFGL